LPKENIPEERTYALLEDEVHLQLIQPIYDALNGSGRIILQMERSGDIKDKKSGLIIAGNSDTGKSAREIVSVSRKTTLHIIMTF
jgi:hypothetical protein